MRLVTFENGVLWRRVECFELSPESDFDDKVNRTWNEITFRHHEVHKTLPTPRLPATGDLSRVVSYYVVDHPILRFNGASLIEGMQRDTTFLYHR